MYQLTQATIFTGPGGPSGVQGQPLRAVLNFGASVFDVASDGPTRSRPETETIRYSTSGTMFTYEAVCPTGDPSSSVPYTATPQALIIIQAMGNQTSVEVFAHL
jgi:hypothetical protein